MQRLYYTTPQCNFNKITIKFTIPWTKAKKSVIIRKNIIKKRYAIMVYLQNEELKVQIKELGAEVQSVITKEGRECTWHGDPTFWKGRGPHLFPICGRLRDNKYIYKGKEYSLGSHGFAKVMEFKAEKLSEVSAVFTLTETEETLVNYPFAFEFKIIYTLKGRTIDVEYVVTNKNDYDMYFSVGGHESYTCEGGIENYYIEFDKNVTLDTYTVVGPIVNHETTRVLENSNILPIKNDYFVVDALVFKDIDFDGFTIKKKDGTYNVRVDFKDFENLLIWSRPDAPFICIEPWLGFPDFDDTDYVFETKVGIQKLAPGKTFNAVHSMTY